MSNKNHKLKALFIDFDGTLIDSVPTLFSAFSDFLRYHERQGTLEEFSTLNGFTAQEIVVCLKVWHGLEEPVEILLKQYKGFIQEAYFRARFFKGSFAFLNWAVQNKIELAIVTASLREWVEPLLVREGFETFFSSLITRDDVQEGKPSPEGYKLALKKLKVLPEEGMAIEDSTFGIEAALGADLKVIQFRSAAHYLPPDDRVLFSGSWPDILSFLQTLERDAQPKVY